MYARSALTTRIAETQRRAASIHREAPPAPRRAMSFTEQYRGTAYETVHTVVARREPRLSRGRTFVVLGAAVATCLYAVIMSAPG
jgi:hypothetical protein